MAEQTVVAGSLPTWTCARGHWTEAGERPASCMAQDDQYPGLCGLPVEYDPKVGDIFVSSWGYDQTNIDFFEVVDVTKSGRSVRVVEVGQVAAHDGGSSERVVPIRGFWRTPPYDLVAPKRLRTHYRDGTPCTPAFFVASYADAYLWDGKPKYQTASGWGH